MEKVEKTDITEEAQMILSCVKRMGERFGVSMTAKVLKGSQRKKVREFKLQTTIDLWTFISLHRKRNYRKNSFFSGGTNT